MCNYKNRTINNLVSILYQPDGLTGQERGNSMRTGQIRKIFSIFILVLLACSLGACNIKNITKSNEEVLRQRVNAMMQAKMDDDWGTVYEFQSPEYKKEVSKKDFLGFSRKMSITSYSIASLEMAPSGKEATVEVKFAANVKGFDFDGMVNTQQWTKIKGTWYEKAEPKGKSKGPF